METYKLLNKELVAQVQILKLNNSRLQLENNQLHKKLSEIHSGKIVERCKINENVNQIFGVLNNLLTVVNPMINSNFIPNETNESKSITTTPAVRKPRSPCNNQSLSPILDISVADPEELCNVSQKRVRRSLRRSLPSFDKNCELNLACSSSSFRESFGKSGEEEEQIAEKSLEHNSIGNKTADGEFKMLSTISEDEETGLNKSKTKDQSSKLSNKELDSEDEISIEEEPIKKVTNRRENIQAKRPEPSKSITEPSHTEEEISIEDAPKSTKKVTNRRENIPAKRPQQSKSISSPKKLKLQSSKSDTEESSESDNESSEISPQKVTEAVPKTITEPFRTLGSKSPQDDSSGSLNSSSETITEADNYSDSNKIHHRRNVAEAVTTRIPKPFRTMVPKSSDKSSDSQNTSSETITKADKSSDSSGNASDQITKINHRRNVAEAVSKRVTKILKAVISNSDSDSDSSSDTIKDVSLPKKIAETIKKRITKPLTISEGTSMKLSPKLTDKSSDNSLETLSNIQKRQKLKETMKKNDTKRITKELSKGELNSPSPKKHKSDTSDSSFNESLESKSKNTQTIKKSKLTKQTAVAKDKALTKKNEMKKVEGALSRKSHLDIENNFNLENQIASSTPVNKKIMSQTSKSNLRRASSILNDITSTSINASNLSSRPRRNNQAVSYTEPNLHTKLRR